MSISISQLISFLGNPVGDLLGFPAFAGLKYKKTRKEELGPEIYYNFGDFGMEVVCNESSHIDSILLINRKDRKFCADLFDFDFSRDEVLEKFGSPTVSGQAIEDEILGEFGPWDRFEIDNQSVHIEYSRENRGVVQMTITRVSSGLNYGENLLS